MKKMDLFCVSPASTAICSSSVDQGSIIRLGGKAIDRHNPHLRDGRRSSSSNRTTSNTITITTTTTTTTTTTKNNHLTIPSSSQLQSQAPSQSESHSKPSKKLAKFYHHNKKSSKGARKSSSSISTSSSAKPKNPNISPPGSTRYLLSDTTSSDLFNEYEPLPSSLVSTESPGSCSTNKLEHDHCRALGPFSPPSSSTSTTTSTTKDHQVVVLRVSLHCRGCEGKVRKHLSKMKGVTSFNIDFAMKKVTVIGDVTPLIVLSSISRVKNAQFWPSLSSVKSAH